MKSGTIELVNSHVYEDGASGRPQGKLISAAARAIGVAAHVLRHWEDEGVLIPGREAQGHRRYNRVDITRGQQIRYAQALGLSLAQIRAFLHGFPADRAMLLRSHHDELLHRAHALLASASTISDVLASGSVRHCPADLPRP